MKSFIDDAGVWHHKFGASWLRTTDLCMERARQEHTGEMPRIESDAACVGTAMHLGAEVCISSGGLTLSDTIEVAQDEFSRLMALDGTNGDPEAKHKEGTFKWIKYDEPKARKLVEKFTTSWWTEVLPTLSIDAITEWNFTVPLVEDDERVIELTGTADYVDDDLGSFVAIKDWKTSGGGKYAPWEYERWAVQPTVYTYAATQLLPMAAYPTFEYVVMHGSTVQRFEVERRQGHFDWLRTKCVDIAKQIELQILTWTKSDNHALCSPLWCPAWDGCKGQALGANPFNQVLK